MSAARHPRVVLLSTAAVAMLMLVLTVGLGEYSIGPGEAVRALIGAGAPESAFVVTELRLPRALTAFAVGAALAMAGVVLQSLTHNPLAAPELVGVSAGANVAAVIVVVLVPGLPLALLPPFAFIGALLASALVWQLAGKGRASAGPLLLTGVAVSAIGYALVLAVISTIDELIQASQLVVFLAGTVYGRGWPEFFSIAPWLVSLGLLSIVLSRPLDALALGDDVATVLGVRLSRMRVGALALAAGLAGAAVATAGPVGFVGLMAPHMARRLVGPHHAVLLPAAALLGGTVVLAADAIARLAFAPVDLPVGVVTAVVGAPYLIWLLLRRQR